MDDLELLLKKCLLDKDKSNNEDNTKPTFTAWSDMDAFTDKALYGTVFTDDERKEITNAKTTPEQTLKLKEMCGNMFTEDKIKKIANAKAPPKQMAKDNVANLSWKKGFLLTKDNKGSNGNTRKKSLTEAERKRIARANRTSEQKKLDNAKNTKRQAEKRAKRTPEQIAKDNEKKAKRQAEKRAERTPDQVAKDNEKKAKHQAEKRADRTPDQVANDNIKEAKYKAEKRAERTHDQVAKDNAKQAKYQAEKKTIEKAERAKYTATFATTVDFWIENRKKMNFDNHEHNHETAVMLYHVNSGHAQYLGLDDVWRRHTGIKYDPCDMRTW